MRLKTKNMFFKEKILVNNDIVVTPYIVDHSSYNSAMLLIEADGKRILHTGDFRSHGLKGDEFIPTLKEINNVDMIITEGTCLSKDEEKFETEEHLQERALEIFKKYDQIFILQSSTNIDRIKSFYEASKATAKNFIEDIFTANITSSLNNPSLPNPIDYSDVYVWIPTKYKKKSFKFKKKYVLPFYKYSKQKSYENNKYVLMVKTTMLEAIEKLYDKNHIKNACLIYSMWNGYKENEDMKSFLEEIKKFGINDIIDLHTSGHASKKTIELLNSLNAKKVIPIHTTNKEALKDILNNVIIVDDKEVIKL